MEQPFVYLKVGGRTCLGQIISSREKWGSTWVTVTPVIGFAIDKEVLLTDCQYAIDLNQNAAA